VPMVERVIQDNKITYRERRLKVDFIERDHPVIIAQPSLLRVIIANLIRNAFQHTHEGAITIEVNRDWLEVVNSSEGGGNQIHGMVPHANDDQTNGGFGIGLDLVRRLCERFGWRFTIETRNGAETVARINF
jgi:signal transduction histidine kinase